MILKLETQTLSSTRYLVRKDNLWGRQEIAYKSLHCSSHYQKIQGNWHFFHEKTEEHPKKTQTEGKLLIMGWAGSKTRRTSLLSQLKSGISGKIWA